MTGFAYWISIALDSKAAQLMAVVVVLIFCIQSGVLPTLLVSCCIHSVRLSDSASAPHSVALLSGLKIHKPLPQQLEKLPGYFITYITYARWLAEQMYIGHTMKLGESAVYRFPGCNNFAIPQNCLLLQMNTKLYSEGPLFCQDSGFMDKVKDAGYYEESDGYGEWCQDSSLLSVDIIIVMHLWLGFTARLVSYFALTLCNRDKRGKDTLWEIFMEHVLGPMYEKLVLSHLAELKVGECAHVHQP